MASQPLALGELSMVSRRHFLAGLGTTVFFPALIPLRAKSDDPPPRRQSPILGRWDLTVKGPAGEYPSWLEVRKSGSRTLVGSFVGQFGSARPISRVEFDQGQLRFSVPPQWEQRQDDLHFEGQLTVEML